MCLGLQQRTLQEQVRTALRQRRPRHNRCHRFQQALQVLAEMRRFRLCGQHLRQMVAVRLPTTSFSFLQMPDQHGPRLATELQLQQVQLLPASQMEQGMCFRLRPLTVWEQAVTLLPPAWLFHLRCLASQLRFQEQQESTR